MTFFDISVAATTLSSICPQSTNTCNLPTAQANNDTISNLLSIAFGIIGSIALLMFTLAGLRYITSGGDPQKAAKARDGLIYTGVGIAIALIAEALINFVVKGVS